MSTQALKTMASGTAAKKDNPVAKFSHFLDTLKPQLALALPRHLNADRMARLALTAFSTSPDLQRCTPQSIAASIMTAAQLGLEPGVNGQGYLIPYKQTCTFVPGWKGLVDLVARSGRATVWTGAVFDGDEFEYQLGDAPFCRHRPGEAEPDAPFTHVYAIGRVKDSPMAVIEVWTRGKVLKHLAKFNKVGDRHYAKKDENSLQMYGRKIALLQVLKYMPSSIELNNAVEIADADDAGKTAVLDGDFVRFTGYVDGAGDASVDKETGEILAKEKGNDTAAVGDTLPPVPDLAALRKRIADPAVPLDEAARLFDDAAAFGLVGEEYRVLLEAYNSRPDMPPGDQRN